VEVLDLLSSDVVLAVHGTPFAFAAFESEEKDMLCQLGASAARRLLDGEDGGEDAGRQGKVPAPAMDGTMDLGLCGSRPAAGLVDVGSGVYCRPSLGDSNEAGTRRLGDGGSGRCFCCCCCCSC